MLIMERRQDGTKGHHFYNDDTQYDRHGYNRMGRYSWRHDDWYGYEPNPKPGVEAPPPPTSPWIYADPTHPGHLRTPDDENDPAKLDAHRIQGEEKQAIRVIDLYESEMQEKYPTGDYFPFNERPHGIQQRFIQRATRLEKRQPGESIEGARE